MINHNQYRSIWFIGNAGRTYGLLDLNVTCEGGSGPIKLCWYTYDSEDDQEYLYLPPNDCQVSESGHIHIKQFIWKIGTFYLTIKAENAISYKDKKLIVHNFIGKSSELINCG